MIPVNVRRIIYLSLAIAGLALGACQVGYASVAIPAPSWLIVASAVYGFLGGSGGVLAVLNTPAPAQEIEQEAQEIADDAAEPGGGI